MKVALAYGKGTLPVELPEENTTVIQPTHVPGLRDERAAMFQALDAPVGCDPLRVLAKAGSRVTIVHTDITRPTPNDRIIPWLLAYLEAAGGAGMVRAESVVLGPGDAVNISAAGYPEYARSGVGVGADGKLTYLQAQDIQAAGLTIDQLREQLNTELRRYYKNMIIMVTPETFQSRKVYVLGKVVKKGAINIDRPLTVLEVVAEAGGLETGLFQQNTVELADLGRSFLVRDSARMPVNMEALFLHGDMTQNIQVQAGDYLYFPSANSNEIYVLGNVKMQGTQGLLAHTSVHSAIAQAGGFSPKAYTRRVLVVRGSLEKPESFVVSMDDLLAARAKGFRLQPKDIVYIADKPWARAEELLGFAVNAFLQGAVSGWTTANVGPFIKQAFLPSLK